MKTAEDPGTPAPDAASRAVLDLPAPADDLAEPHHRPRAPLVLKSAAEPYGYSVTLWTCSALLAYSEGRPAPGAIACYALGALVGFGLTNLLLARASEWSPAKEWSFVRSMHLGPVLTAVAVTLLATALCGPTLAWALGGAAASGGYFGGVCIEHRLIR
jgi:hypothetical protein